MILFTPNCHFFDNFVKNNLTAAGVSNKDIWFSLLIPRIKLDPPPQGKNALVYIFQVLNQKEMTKILVLGWGSKNVLDPHPLHKN